LNICLLSIEMFETCNVMYINQTLKYDLIIYSIKKLQAYAYILTAVG